MPVLSLPPDQAGYTVTDGNEVVRTQLDGGAGRYRRDIVGASSRVTVQWTTDRQGYQYLKSFYRVAVASGSAPFTVSLIIDEPELTEHEAYFIPNSMRLTGVQGHTYIVSAELEVLKDDTDVTYDSSIIMLYEAYGDDGEAILASLDQLVNVDIPGA